MTQEAAMFNEWANDMDQVYAPFNTYEDFKAAPEAPMYTFDENIVSDLFKDAHGYRPSGSFWVTWEQASNLRKQIIWDDLIDELNLSVDRERRERERALDRFEGLVAKTIEHGAWGRETAIRWIVESLDMGKYATAQYACYHLGLSYSCANLFDGILPMELK
jgi:hypothetical protein